MKQERLAKFAILSLAIAYFLLFVPLSLLGARDRNMLAVFNLDEYAQYSDVLNRAVWGPPFRQWIENFFAYIGTQYGYLFSLICTIIVMFIRAVSRWTGGWDATQANIFILRQLCVACSILGSYCLSKMFSDPGDRLRQIVIFAFLLLVPGAFMLNVLWKPDQAVYLLVALALYWTSRALEANSSSTRALLLGTFFFGMAAGLKAYGWFAGPLILLASVRTWGPRFWQERVRLLNLGGVFVGGFLVSQPVMIWPPTASRVAGRLLESVRNSTKASDMNRIPTNLTSADLTHWYQNSFHYFYGHWIFLVAALVATVAGSFLNKERNGRYLVVLVWFIPISIYVTTQIVYTGEQRYWLPMWMPVIAAFLSRCFTLIERHRLSRFGLIACVIAVVIPTAQAGAYLKMDVLTWRAEVVRERDAPSIRFYEMVQRNWLTKLPKNRTYSLFHDPYVYWPRGLVGFDPRMNFKDTTYSDVVALPTDILLLQADYIKVNASNDNLAQKKASRLMWDTYVFYSDVRDDKLKGFKKVYQDKFGIFFVSDALYRQLPPSFWK